MATISEQSQIVIDQLLFGESTGAREAALQKVAALPDPEAVAGYLLARLPGEEDAWRRAWCYSALAQINKPDTAAVLAARLSPAKEDFVWARYWLVIALAKMKPPEIKRYLLKATRDEDEVVRAVALRQLVEQDLDARALDQLLDMVNTPRSNASWAACKALRKEAGQGALRESVEKRCLPALVARLNDNQEWIDCRQQAARALADLKFMWLEAAQALSEALVNMEDDWARRLCVDGLVNLNHPEVKDGLLRALCDRDAEIRVRAADGLKTILGSQQAVIFIGDYLIQQKDAPEVFVDALRRIDRVSASQEIARKLIDPSPEVKDRAEKLLYQLGGEEALRTLQSQNADAMEKYTTLLQETDEKTVTHFNQLIQQARTAFMMSMWMHAIIFGLGVIVLVASLYLALAQGLPDLERFIGAGGAAGSLGVLMLIFYKNPLRNIQQSVVELVKVNVVFLGYVRQVNQVDASFKQRFLASAIFDSDELKRTVVEIRETVKQTMDEIQTHMAKAEAE